MLQNVAPGAIAEAQFKLTPPWAGRFQISAKFTSKEMHDVDGFHTFMVKALETNGIPLIDANETNETRQI